MGHLWVNGPLMEVICATRGYMGHSGGTWVTQGVHGSLRGIWANQGMYLGHSGDVYGPLRGCIWATQVGKWYSKWYS